MSEREDLPTRVWKNATGASPFLVVADHVGKLFATAARTARPFRGRCRRHIPCDIGIAALCGLLATALGVNANDRQENQAFG
jgi:predicted N-formylglutamate amidohydrolase